MKNNGSLGLGDQVYLGDEDGTSKPCVIVGLQLDQQGNTQATLAEVKNADRENHRDEDHSLHTSPNRT